MDGETRSHFVAVGILILGLGLICFCLSCNAIALDQRIKALEVKGQTK